MGSRGASSGTGRSTTVLGYKAYNKMPKGWKYTEGATTAPFGYAWANNGKSRFGGEYESALVRDELSQWRPIYSDKNWTVAKDRASLSDDYIIQSPQLGRAGLSRIIRVTKDTDGRVAILESDRGKIPNKVIAAIEKN